MTEVLKQAMVFLRSHLPQSDLDCYGDALLRQFAEHALMLRRTAPWCAALEQELFNHYVLCPRVNDEDLSFYTKVFFDALWQRIVPLGTMEARILEVNRWCGEMANYQMQDDRTASALTVFRNGSGRCGEESVFLVAALRSVGIPARQVYAPRWAHCEDNHAWVEAWCDGAWHFLGACEPEPVLDRGWFNTPASRALLVHSRIFGEGHGSCHGTRISRDNGVCWYNQTGRYAHTRSYRFRVLRGGNPAPGAKIHIQVLNESSFHTIATLTADSEGCGQIQMGLGAFHVLAVQENFWAETDCAGEETVLHLKPMVSETTAWHSFDVPAPRSSNINEMPLTAPQKQRRKADRNRCGLHRTLREEGFRQFAAEHPQWEDLPLQARGNGKTVAAFLEADTDPARERLLRTLTAKDLRDVTPEVLEDHLCHAPERGSIPEDVYNRYVLCPRIALEPLRPWRQQLQLEFAAFWGNPAALWEHLTARVEITVEPIYENLHWPPLESWKAGRCDEKSRKLLFIAVLRSLGIPARLRPLDGEPEYWQDGQFRTLHWEKTGILQLTGDTVPVYRQNWTLSRWNPDGWDLMNPVTASREIKLPAGLYRLITTRRMPSGNQYAAMRNLVVTPGQVTQSDLHLRDYALADMLGSQKLPPMTGETLLGEVEAVDTRAPSLLLWLEEGAEPTEHLLAELLAQQAHLEKLPLTVTVLLRSRESLRNVTLGKLLGQWPGIRVLLDDWAYDLEAVARCLTCDPDTLPLAVVCEETGTAVFGASGYRVGLGRLLTEIAAYLCE